MIAGRMEGIHMASTEVFDVRVKKSLTPYLGTECIFQI